MTSRLAALASAGHSPCSWLSSPANRVPLACATCGTSAPRPRNLAPTLVLLLPPPSLHPLQVVALFLFSFIIGSALSQISAIIK